MCPLYSRTGDPSYVYREQQKVARLPVSRSLRKFDTVKPTLNFNLKIIPLIGLLVGHAKIP